MPTYCEYAPGRPFHERYHDEVYGFPTRDESALLERLVMEINQAGLSWELILKRQAGMHAAYDGFDVDTVADYGEDDVARLLADARIIRNKLKVRAAIHNAGVIRGFRETHGGFAGWLDAHDDGRDKASWVTLFKTTFKFTGGEITGEFLMSVGRIPGAHHEGCPVFARIAALR
ncbi:MAG: DNA-3-methyladenine glycosylase I [Proteobacteria bacterium]|nr:DNA-3-methyladenine glycosylase I [Pseudomonadota bacterium]